MLDHVRALTRGTLDVLELLAVFCGLALFAFAAFSLFAATVRVAVRGRVLVLPFSGSEPRRIELTDLFVRRLTEIEQEWIGLARQIETTRKEINERPEKETFRAPAADAPITSGGRLPPLTSVVAEMAAVTAPRTTGDELLDNVVQLERVGSIATADLGVISLAGVSFSPRDVLALLRAAPGIFARRTLRGAIIPVEGGSLASVEFEERGFRNRRRRRRTQVAEVRNDAWLTVFEDLAYRLAKDRVYLVRDRDQHRPSARKQRRTDPLTTPSRTVRDAVIEAESWDACHAFLLGYAAHLRHYRHGSASDREDALEFYDRALSCQPGFPRAAHNQAVLLYNRYHPEANDQAIEKFAEASESRDPTLKPLALAGLAMANCQAIQRFSRSRDDHEQPARDAARQALELAPQLEEAVFAVAWILQIEERWADAIRQYESVVELEGATAAERRIKSFALNNAAWITLFKLGPGASASRAEELLWRALDLYPNKIAYANLGEIARRSNRHAEAIELYDVALRLDPSYTNALNERAIIRAELAGAAAAGGDADEARRQLEAADADAANAQELAQPDATYAAQLRKDFDQARRAAIDAAHLETAADDR